ncbi:MAG: tRNA (N(6)-L-threonylcarbamoyladenosine(37)-C(2))-methylthiotransferase MtaB [Clostridia bacterium]|nr:tRNA (N(6)-L-threonylcarbamoyladenosine(37)-C(2))-methylthiotransferase MtaB [Clostridia bacterium]
MESANKKINTNKKVAFYTLGCKVNQYETNGMTQKFIEKGYEIIDVNNDKADICIVNTCTVTNMSDRKSRQTLRKVKERNKNAIIVAVGCYAQVAKDELEKMEEIDIVLGNEEKKDIIKYINQYIEDKNRVIEIDNISEKKEFNEIGQITYTEKTRAVIKIQDGCNQFCSYCIIPYARGRVRSRKEESIIDEIKKIAENGIKEIVITGIHIASYGTDFGNKDGLIELLEKINEIEGIERIRLGSLEPKIITEQFVQRLEKLEKVCHHFHLSLQSGCDAVLKRMNRKYNTQEFREIVEILRKQYQDVMLTTDIIVGFPGESEEEFEETYKFLKEIKFYKMHVFPYSQRSGTRAAAMPEQVDGNIKEKRSKRLIELSNNNQKEYNDKYIGEKVKVLFEEKENDKYKGHTQNYILVKYHTQEVLENVIKEVKVLKSDIEYIEA